MPLRKKIPGDNSLVRREAQLFCFSAAAKRKRRKNDPPPPNVSPICTPKNLPQNTDLNKSAKGWPHIVFRLRATPTVGAALDCRCVPIRPDLWCAARNSDEKMCVPQRSLSRLILNSALTRLRLEKKIHTFTLSASRLSPRHAVEFIKELNQAHYVLRHTAVDLGCVSFGWLRFCSNFCSALLAACK